ncbi:sulfatase [Candidatus Bathyarchaeota archaeon]|nr:MAG: sulfatase [Candidatus Bathyarchaeota archaeon]
MKREKKPNILIIITHDTGRHLGCYGSGVDTPNLNKLAEEGVIFTNFFCTAPQCSPSRASLLTGRYPHNNGLIGLTHRGFRLNANELLLPNLLAQAGYSTYLFGFQHESPNPYSLGYQKIFKAKSNSCLDVTPLVIDFLENNKLKKPFFMMIGFSETHRPFPQYEGPVDNIEGFPYLPDVEDVRRDIASLNILVRRVDEKIGEILRSLDEADLRDDTLVVFTTDHGVAFPGAKATLFDPGIEISMIMRGPGGFEGGRKIEALLSNLDFAPTILDLCGIPIPTEMQGKSILPIIRGEAKRLHRQIFVEQTYHAAYDPIRGVRTDRYKYIRSFEKRPFWFPPNVDGGLSKEVARRFGYFNKPRPPEMLFDLESDPIERNNLVNDPEYTDILKRMRLLLEDWMRRTSDPLLKGYVPPPPNARVTPPDSYTP